LASTNLPLPAASPTGHRTFTLSTRASLVQLVSLDARQALHQTRRAAVDEAVQALSDAIGHDPSQRWDLLDDERDISRKLGEGRITGWSAKSRRNLLRHAAGTDFSGRFAMVTLTYPGDWVTYCPDPATLHAHRKAFERRFDRAFGPLRGVWKLEFQRRGAPHLHYTVDVPGSVPAARFAKWVREAWHAVVVHPNAHQVCVDGCAQMHHRHNGAHADLGFADRVMDAGKSLAAYLAKHGVWSSKEYQHSIERAQECAPAFRHPGRWWGFTRLPMAAVLEQHLDPDDARLLKLLLRKVVARRTWRYVEVPNCRPVLVRRSLRSLRAEQGFWLNTSSQSELLVQWCFDTIPSLRGLSGAGLARALIFAGMPPGEYRPPPGARGLRSS